MPWIRKGMTETLNRVERWRDMAREKADGMVLLVDPEFEALTVTVETDAKRLGVRHRIFRLVCERLKADQQLSDEMIRKLSLACSGIINACITPNKSEAEDPAHG